MAARLAQPFLVVGVAAILAVSGCSVSMGGSSDSGASTSATAPVRQDRVDWLKANAIPLSFTAQDGPRQEFDPIIKRLAGARLVGLGEGTHGTKEFNDLRFALFKRMVETGNTRYIVLEADAGAAEQLNTWLTGGPGSLNDAMRQQFVYYRTEPYAEFYTWIREWNAQHPRDQVQLWGGDIQSGTEALAALRARQPSLRSVVDDAQQRLARLDEVQGVGWPQQVLASPEAAAAEYERRGWDENTLVALEKKFTAAAQASLAKLAAAAAGTRDRRAEFLAMAARRSTGLATAVLSFYLNTGQFAKVNQLLAKGTSGIAQRDRQLADQTEWVVNAYGDTGSGVYLAHNDHVAMNVATGGGGEASGKLLREKLGEDYRAVLTVFDEGGFGASEQRSDSKPGKGYDSFTVKPIDRATLSGKLAKAGLNAGWLWVDDLDPANPEHVWLFDPLVSYSVGGTFSHDDFMAKVVGDRRTMVFPEVADAVLFVRKTTASPLDESRLTGAG